MTDTWDEGDVIPCNLLIWKTEFPTDIEKDTNLLIVSTYGGKEGDLEIRNGSLEWWEKYHSRHQLVRWAITPVRN
jgi:hypothetical protein